jgi:hypothetical protein
MSKESDDIAEYLMDKIKDSIADIDESEEVLHEICRLCKKELDLIREIREDRKKNPEYYENK